MITFNNITLIKSINKYRGTHLTIPLKAIIIKRFGGGKKPLSEGVGHGFKILQALAKKTTPPLNATSIANTPQGASSNKPKPEDIAPKIPLVPSELVIVDSKPSFKDTIVNLGAKVFHSVPTPYGKFNVGSEEPNHVRQNKEIILGQLDYFDVVPSTKTKDNEHLLKYLRELLQKDPQCLLLRQGQVVQEILFNKRPFEEELVRDYFKAFQIIDIIGKNKGFMDASTLYSVLAATYLYDNFDFLKEVDPRIIYSGCVYPLTGLTKEQEDFIRYSKAATGNTICDASLARKNFDMKALPSPTNNYLVLWNYESFNIHGDVIRAQNALYSVISKIPLDSRTNFQKELFILLNDLKTAPFDTLQKQLIINAFAIKALSKMTLADRISLIFPVTRSSFKPNPVYDDAVKKITIPSKRTAIDTAESKKAIMGFVNTWDKSKQDKFAEVTFNQNEDDV